MVKVVVDNQIFQCRDYHRWGDHIVLYDVSYEESKWKQVEIFNISTIMAFKGEIIEDMPW